VKITVLDRMATSLATDITRHDALLQLLTKAYEIQCLCMNITTAGRPQLKCHNRDCSKEIVHHLFW